MGGCAACRPPGGAHASTASGYACRVSDEPTVVHEDEREWEGWPAEQVAGRGGVRWRTLISGDATPTSGLTLGVARVPPGEALHLHHHAQPEVYFVLSGAGTVTLDGIRTALRPGSAVFLPGGVPHALSCDAGETELRLVYALAADAFGDVEYVFEGE